MVGNICMRFPEGKHKILTLSYDDGVGADIRLIEIMRQHGRDPSDGWIYDNL